MRVFIFALVLAGCSTPPPTDKNTVYVISSFCGEPCPWNAYKLHSDSAVFTSTNAALSQARSWSTMFGVSSQAIDIMLSYWTPGQDLDVEFPLDGGRQLDLLLYTDKVQP